MKPAVARVRGAVPGPSTGIGGTVRPGGHRRVEPIVSVPDPYKVLQVDPEAEAR